MKKIVFLGYYLCIGVLAFAQPKNVNYEKQDFLLNVLGNPTLCLEDFRDVGLNETNTSLEPASIYLNTKSQYFHSLMIKAVGKDDYNTRKVVYNKVAAAWRVFKQIQYAGGTRRLGSAYNIFDTRYKETSPELRHKLSIVPLKLTKY